MSQRFPMWKIVAVAGLGCLAWAAGGGCRQNAGGKSVKKPTTCTLDADCPAGQVCEDLQCVPGLTRCAGDYIGQFTGPTTGQVLVMISEDGIVQGELQSDLGMLEFTGTVSPTGEIVTTSLAADVQGQLGFSDCSVSGTWSAQGFDGTWEATRMGAEGMAEGDVGLGRLFYSGRCYDCHGTPGRGNGDASDLLGVSAAELAARLSGGDHGDVPEEYLTVQTCLDVEAFLAVERGGTGEMPCGALTDAALEEYRGAIEADRDSGTTKEAALDSVLQMCQLQMLLDDGALFQDCWACLSEDVENAYP